jgi:hypothetical protein
LVVQTQLKKCWSSSSTAFEFLFLSNFNLRLQFSPPSLQLWYLSGWAFQIISLFSLF